MRIVHVKRCMVLRGTDMAKDLRRVALWRAVNVGGRNTVAMADLRACLAEVGCLNPRTLLQSGNAVFGSRLQPRVLEARLEAVGRTRLTLDAAVLVRSADEWADIIAGNPFPEATVTDPNRLLVMCLRARVSDGAAAALGGAVQGRERVHVAGRHVYLLYRDGIGTSRLTSAAIERALGTTGTARNWNTVMKLQTLLQT